MTREIQIRTSDNYMITADMMPIMCIKYAKKICKTIKKGDHRIMKFSHHPPLEGIKSFHVKREGIGKAWFYNGKMLCVEAHMKGLVVMCYLIYELNKTGSTDVWITIE